VEATFLAQDQATGTYAAAWAALYACWQPRLRGWVAHLNRRGLLCQADVDDFLQDAYTLLIQAVRRYDPTRQGSGRFRTFLEHIVARRFHNYVRQRRHALGELRPLVALDQAESPRTIWPPGIANADPAQDIEEQEFCQRIHRALDVLSSGERYVLRAVAAGMSVQAIAEHLGCSQRTAWRLKSNAIIHMRELLGEELFV
jgi:RNA polymerase sigma factor (sigma-70 family)